MTKKSKFSFFFLSIICISFFISISLFSSHQNYNSPFNFTNPKSNLPFEANYEQSDQDFYWRNYTNTNDFENWYYIDYNTSIIDWDNTSETLHCRMYKGGSVSGQKFYVDLIHYPVISNLTTTNDIGYYNYSFRWKLWEVSGIAYTKLQIRAYFQDDSYQLLFNKYYEMGSYGPGDEIISGTYTADKTFDYLLVYMEIEYRGGIGDIEFWLFDEDYKIYLPLAENFQIYPNPLLHAIELGDQVKFECDIYPNEPTYSRTLIIQYLTTNITANYELTPEFFSPVKNSKYLSFNLTGAYIAQIRVRNAILNYSETEAKAFIVYDIGAGYPKSTYLSLWSPYDDLSLTGRLKTYLGEDECYKICDFQNDYNYGTNLTWRPIYPLSVNQPDFIVANNRLYLTCYGSEFGYTSGNGVEADLEDTINITYYDSLKFSLKVKNTSNFNLTSSKALTIYLNPTAMMGDYRLNLSAYTDYLNEWLTFIIPFKLFSLIYYGEILAELGFYSPASSGTLDCEIRDIYACNYNTLYAIINDSEQVFTTNETVIRSDLTPLYSEFINTTGQTFDSIINQTFYENLTIDTGFNNSQGSWENIAINNNETIQLDTYTANLTYYNDSFPVYYSQFNQSFSESFIFSNNYTEYYNYSQNVSWIDLGDSQWTNYTDVGDFIDWYISSGSFDTYDDTSDELELYIKTVQNQNQEGIAVRDLDFLNNTPSNNLYYNVSLNYRLWRNNIWGGSGQINVRFYYTDGTYSEILTQSVAGGSGDTGVVTEVLTGYFSNDKTIDYIRAYLYTQDPGPSGSHEAYLWITSEDYKTITHMDSNHTDQLANFTSVDLEFITMVNFTHYEFESYIHDANEDIDILWSFRNASEEWTEFANYSTEINVLGKYARFCINFTDTVNLTYTPVFYNLTFNYSYNQYLIEQVFNYTFNIDKANVTSFYFNISYSFDFDVSESLFLLNSTDWDNITSLPQTNLEYYLLNSSVYWRIVGSAYSGVLYSLNIDFVNITIEYSSFNNSGYYLSQIYDFNYTVSFNNLTYQWNNIQALNVSLAFSNDSISFSNFMNYSTPGTIEIIGRFIKFQLDFETTIYNETPIFYNISLNYSYFQYTLNINFSKEFNIPQNSLINFTFNWCGYSNMTVDSAYLNMLNFSSSQFYNIDNITNTSQIITFNNNSNFYSNLRNFTWNINASYTGVLSFSITQVNYSISYYRYQFDRRVLISTVDITGYDDNLYGWSFEPDFTSETAYLSLNLADLTETFYNLENFSKYDNFTLFRRFVDYGLPKSLVSAIQFNFTLPNCSSYNENASITFSKFFLYENQTYRLISQENRMYSDVLSFDSEVETLCLTDYWGDIIFREELNRTAIGEYYDLLIPYFTIRITNYETHDIIFRVEKNNVVREFRILASWELELKLILSDYKLVVVDGVEEVVIYEGVLSHTSRGAFSYGTAIPFINWEEIAAYYLKPEPPFYEDTGFWVGTIVGIVGLILPLDYLLVRRRYRGKNKNSAPEEEEKNHQAQNRSKKTPIIYPKSTIEQYKKRRF